MIGEKKGSFALGVVFILFFLSILGKSEASLDHINFEEALAEVRASVPESAVKHFTDYLSQLLLLAKAAADPSTDKQLLKQQLLSYLSSHPLLPSSSDNEENTQGKIGEKITLPLPPHPSHVNLPSPWPPRGLPANATMIIRSAGYPCDDHNVTTPDGFILSIQHIPHGRSGPNNTTQGKGVVFLQHGMTDCSVGWTLNGPDESLAFILADNGFDVWLGNNRGTLNSLAVDKNRSLYPSEDANYYSDWNWSWDQEGEYDITTMIPYALSNSNATKLTYIGHSQGTSQAFAGFIKNNTFASQNINLFVALAPVCYLGSVGSNITRLAADLYLDEIELALGIYESWLPAPNVTRVLLPLACSNNPTFCMEATYPFCGPTSNLNATRFAYYTIYEPSPVSTQDMSHYAQEIRTYDFSMYNYGLKGNKEQYGQDHPPSYDLSQFPADVPVALFYGGNDYFADPTDVQMIIDQLPVAPFTHFEPEYAHLDPLLGVTAKTDIYPIIVELIEKANNDS